MPDDDDDLYARTEDGAASEGDEDFALSPADGYFGGSSRDDDEPRSGPQPAGQSRTSANVPIVPNVMVVDPTLRPSATAEAKAREAAESASSAPGPEPPLQSVSDPSPGRRGSDSSQSHAQVESGSPALDRGSEDGATNLQNAARHQPPPSDASPSWQRPAPATQPTHHSRGHGPMQYLDAPPAYSPRPGPSYGAIAHSSTAVSSPAHDVFTPSEQQPLLSTTPHSLTSQFPEVASPSLFRMHFDCTAGGKAFRKRAVLLLVTLVLLVIAVTILIGLLLGSLPQVSESPRFRQRSQTLALLSTRLHASITDRQQNHEYIEEPVKPPGAPDGDMLWRPLPSCRQKSNSRLAVGQSYHFDAHRNLTILQLTKDGTTSSGRAIQTFGELIIRPATGSFFPAGYFAVESMANHDSLGFTFSLDPDDGALKVATPGTIRNWQDRDAEPCIQLRIILYVPRETVLQALDIQTQHLDVGIEAGTIMSVAEDVQILTFSGDVTAPASSRNESFAPYRLEAPSIVVQSLTGQIRGWFPLYEDLALITRFGNIAATIGQKLPRSRQSTPSTLALTSLHGNISAQELSQSPAVDVRPRDHKVAIETETGHIWAETLYSSSAHIKSIDGTLNVSLTPAFDADCIKWGYDFCTVLTETKSGTSHVLINAPSRADVSGLEAPTPKQESETLDDASAYETRSNASALHSWHASSSGDLFAIYPSEWEGTIMASTFTGHMNYTGKGLVMKPWDAINKRMKGVKGDGGSRMIVVSREGNQRVTFGNGPL